MGLTSGGTLLTAEEYHESLRAYQPKVFIDGDRVESVADDPRLAPGIRAVGVTYDFAQRVEFGGLMLAEQQTSGKQVNRMLHINRHTEDLLSKLEAVRFAVQREWLRSALPHPRCTQCHFSVHPSARRESGIGRVPRAFPRLSSRGTR